MKNKFHSRKTIIALMCGCATAAAAFCWGSGSTSFLLYLFALLCAAFGVIILYGLSSLVSDDLADNKLFIIVIIGIVLFGYFYLVIYQSFPHAD